jgi:uncharacterized membrane protein
LTGRDGSRENPPDIPLNEIVTALPLSSAIFRIGQSPLRTFALAALPALMLVAASAHPARADFRLCNNTGSRVGVALGYKDAEGWTTEGWWNISARSCDTLLRGALVARYYYIYAVDYDRGGEWSGHAYMCSREKEFTIRGTDNCLARGYDRTGFFEVDTTEQRSWTVQLTDTAEQPPDRPLPPRAPIGPSRAPSAAPTAPQGGAKESGKR